jgi:hypothetical protein
LWSEGRDIKSSLEKIEPEGEQRKKLAVEAEQLSEMCSWEKQVDVFQRK